jgi:hypothetical protein
LQHNINNALPLFLKTPTGKTDRLIDRSTISQHFTTFPQ